MKNDNKNIARPKSANNPTKYTDKQECTNLDTKHKNINKKLKDKTFKVQQNNNDGKFYVQELTKQVETQKQEVKEDGRGGFNVFYNLNNEIGIKIAQDQKRVKNADFNNIFITSLLEICGEKTIDAGKSANKNQYFDMASGNLSEALENAKQEFKHSKDLNDNQKSIFLAYLFARTFQTLNLKVSTMTEQMKKLPTFQTTEQFLSFAARWLCKIFLFQMDDRKPKNMVVIEREEENAKLDFCEIDLDDNFNFGNDKESTSVIFCNYSLIDGQQKQKYKQKWRDVLSQLVVRYNDLIKCYKATNNGTSELENAFKDMIKNYTMIPQKIEELIKKTALKAKYMGLTEEQVINGIKDKMELWKYMLNDEKNGEVVNRIYGIKDAREKTLDAIKKIKQKDIENIVRQIMAMHHFAYEDKPEERKIKDDFEIHKKSKKNSVILTNKEIEEQIAIIRQENIDKFRRKKQQEENSKKKKNCSIYDIKINKKTSGISFKQWLKNQNNQQQQEKKKEIALLKNMQKYIDRYHIGTHFRDLQSPSAYVNPKKTILPIIKIHKPSAYVNNIQTTFLNIKNYRPNNYFNVKKKQDKPIKI